MSGWNLGSFPRTSRPVDFPVEQKSSWWMSWRASRPDAKTASGGTSGSRIGSTVTELVDFVRQAGYRRSVRVRKRGARGPQAGQEARPTRVGTLEVPPVEDPQGYGQHQGGEDG